VVASLTLAETNQPNAMTDFNGTHDGTKPELLRG